VSEAAQLTPEERLERWTSRDRAIGLAAQRDQLRHQLAARDTEVADLRERLAHLTNTVGQLQAEKAKLVGLVQHGAHGSVHYRLYRRLRSAAGRLLRS
jgi:uncharacterized coiled-coil DUF342 family protein